MGLYNFGYRGFVSRDDSSLPDGRAYQGECIAGCMCVEKTEGEAGDIFPDWRLELYTLN